MTTARQDNGNPFATDNRIMRRVLGRREALGLMTMASTAALLSACGDSGGDTPTPGPTPGPAPTPGPTPTPTPTTCAVTKAEVAGPFPANGSNSAPGLTSNVLTQNGIVRTDVRASFITSTAITPGIATQIVLTLVNTNAACAPLVGYAVYIWSANAQGQFSLYDAPNESWLRGVQVTNAQGAVSFTTIIPGVDGTRYPHFHIQVFPTAAAATAGQFAILTTQLILPASVAQASYTDPTNYAGQAAKFAAVSLATDPVFGDNSAAENTALTPVFNGGIASGFTAALTIGIAV